MTLKLKDISLVTKALSDYVDSDVSIAVEYFPMLLPGKYIRLNLRIGYDRIVRHISMEDVSAYSDEDIGMVLGYMLMEYFNSNLEFYPDGYEGWSEYLKKFMEDQNGRRDSSDS